jgi:hypothetical protein
MKSLYNAIRFKVDLGAFPKILAVDHACNTLEAFRNALPESRLVTDNLSPWASLFPNVFQTPMLK